MENTINNKCRYVLDNININFDILININKDYDSDIEYSSLLGLSNKYTDEKWNMKHFSNFFFDTIVLSALSKKEFEALNYNSHTLRKKALNNLRKKRKDNTLIIEDGEVAEVFLYGIMREYYGAINLVPKIFYKQNNNDNVKGADSVHITCTNDEVGVWFGEAKFYTDLDNAINESIKSVSDFLQNKIKKEISISHDFLQSDYKDINNYEKLYQLLKEENMDNLKEHLHIPIFILYEEQLINNAKKIDDFAESIRNKFEEKYILLLQKLIEKLKEKNIIKFQDIKFHIILFPVLNKIDTMNTINRIVDLYEQMDGIC